MPIGGSRIIFEGVGIALSIGSTQILGVGTRPFNIGNLRKEIIMDNARVVT